MHDIVLKRIFILLGIALFCWVLFLLKPVVIPFGIALVLAYLFNPLVSVIQRFHLPRWLSITVVIVGIGFLFTLAVWFFVPVIWKQILFVKDRIPEMIYWVNAVLLPWVSTTFNLERIEIDVNEISRAIMSYIQENYNVANMQSMVLRLAQSGLGVIQVGGLIVLIPIIAFYLLLDWESMIKRFHRLIPRRMEGSVIGIVKECDRVLVAFIKGQLLVMILLGMIYAIGLQLIGIEVGLIIGIVAGLASIIPYLGFAVGIVAAVIACLLQFGLDWVHLLLVLGVFMLGQAIEGYVLQPFLLGDKIGLSPVAVVFSVLAGAQLLGFAGMLIALPVSAVLVVLLKHLRQFYIESDYYNFKGHSLILTEAAAVDVENHADEGGHVVKDSDIDKSNDTTDKNEANKDGKNEP